MHISANSPQTQRNRVNDVIAVLVDEIIRRSVSGLITAYIHCYDIRITAGDANAMHSVECGGAHDGCGRAELNEDFVHGLDQLPVEISLQSLEMI